MGVWELGVDIEETMAGICRIFSDRPNFIETQEMETMRMFRYLLSLSTAVQAGAIN